MLAPARPSEARLRVVTTTEDLAAIAREVGGDQVEVSALAKGYQDPHFVDAKPSYLIKLQKADLFVEVGRDLEVGWVPPLLNSARNLKILPGAEGFLDASALVHILEIPASVSRAQGDVHPLGNPHYWLDPDNGAGIADAIRGKLAELDPADAAGFQRRADAFKKKLAEALKRWEARSDALGLRGMKVVTYHRSWSYFIEHFGLEAVDFIEPKPGVPPSPQHLQQLTERIRSDGVKLLVVEPYFDSKLPEKIARQTGARLAVLPTSVGAEKGIETYFDLFDRQMDLLAQALGQPGRP
jgi:ABC-type Zn uptake system ZnuABC Zn-binding protein ZnuA